MLYPCPDDGLGDVVVTKGLDEDLTAARKLTAENAMRTVRFVQGPPFVAHRATQVLGSVLILELLDSVAIRALEEEPDHRIVEAAVDEVVDDGAKCRLAPELLEMTHGSKTWSNPLVGSRASDECPELRERGVQVDFDVRHACHRIADGKDPIGNGEDVEGARI